ncbi:MAG: hypothetical protein IPN72_06990 [Saprospiraceae bacterium]|nr:hypothetical protein [Saprospiraceae bacterium]
MKSAIIKYHSTIKINMLMLMLAVGFLNACSKDESGANISSDLQPYFERFSTEAVSRGKNINVLDSDLIASLSIDLPPTVIGQCQHNSAKPNEIKISLKDWQKFSDLQKEYVVFHELGHCILLRSHTNEKNANGFCTSIMESGGGVCRMNYTTSNRAVFIDELFNN